MQFATVLIAIIFMGKGIDHPNSAVTEIKYIYTLKS